MIQFYAPDIEKTLSLPQDESAHCVRVLRKKAGDEIYVTDGKGNRFICNILDADQFKTKLNIKDKICLLDEKGYSLTLAIAPTKNSDRMEWLAEKAVEIGVDKIVLLGCERSERKILKTDRILRIMVSAMKQSLDTKLPVLTELIDFREFVISQDDVSKKFFGYCSAEYPKKLFVEQYTPGGDVVVMIGPEGDFSPSEVDLAVNQGFIPVTFGNKRLRTETAGLFAICAVTTINQQAQH